jgi:uncharacterized membrane protein
MLTRLPRLPLALLASSALSVAFVLARASVTGRPGYGFLLWNLMLAWIPYALARLIAARARRDGGTLAMLALGLAFIGFLPNAPYIVTDLMHLRWQTADAPHWFDALMLASFAWSGLTLGIASVRITADVVKERVGARASIGYVGIVSVLTAFGIYLGRFVRLNTWDAAVHPFRVARSVLAPLVHPATHMRAWTFTVAFAALFLVAYVTAHRRTET